MESDDIIEAVNSKNDGNGLKLGHNRFSGMSNEDFAKFTGGLDEAKFENEASERGFAKNKDGRKLNRLLSSQPSVNWAQQGKTGEVLNQGLCAGCYAFSTTLTVASSIAIKYDTDYVPLSEQQVIDCSKQGNSVTPAWSYNQGCSGGWIQGTFNHMAVYGLMTAEAYPYNSDETLTHGACQYDATRLSANTQNISYGGKLYNLQAALDHIQTGTINVGIKIMCDEFRLYESGIVSEADTSACISTSHAAVLVGYNDGTQCGGSSRVITTVKTCDPASESEIASGTCDVASAFMQTHETLSFKECCTETVSEETVSEDCEPHWILQNSYGTEWGMDGFMHIKAEEGWGAFKVNSLMEYVIV